MIHIVNPNCANILLVNTGDCCFSSIVSKPTGCVVRLHIKICKNVLATIKKVELKNMFIDEKIGVWKPFSKHGKMRNEGARFATVFIQQQLITFNATCFLFCGKIFWNKLFAGKVELSELLDIFCTHAGYAAISSTSLGASACFQNVRYIPNLNHGQ